MRKITRYAQTSALPAIAAALALTSTTALAQEVPQSQPVTTETSTPPTTTEPAPSTEPAASTEAPPATDTSTATETTDTRAASTAAPTRAVRTTARKPAVTRTVTRTATRTSAPAAASAPVMATKPAAPVAPASESAVTPVVDVNSKPAAPAPAAAKQATDDNIVPIAAGGALGLLALGGAAFAISRRRRHEEEEEWIEEESMEHEPVAEAAEPMPRHDPIIHEEQPAIVAPSAFAWGDDQPRDAAVTPASSVDEDDRMPGESWVQRAYRGPTPNNPSVSLKNRLKRAAFFDKRERDVAAGTAEPVDMDAGLPEALVEEQERELA